MEILILAIVELAGLLATVILPLCLDLLVLAGNLLALLFGVVASALGLDTPKIGRTKEVPARVAARRAKVKRWILRISAGAAGLLLILLTALAVANAFFFESLTGWAFGQAEKRAGISLAYGRVEGSLWTGRFSFRDLAARRLDHPRSVFDFRVDAAEVDISMRDLLRQKVVFDRLKVAGVEGSFEQLTKAEPAAKGSKKKGLKPRRSFVINNFDLDGVTVHYRDQTLTRPRTAEFKLDHLRAEAISSRTVAADLLFRSNAAGSFDGVAFSIVNDKRTAASRTTWTGDNLTVGALAAILGGPFDWFEEGRVDIRVDNQGLAEQGVTMDWNLTFRDFQVQAPAGTSPAVMAWSGPVTTYLNSKSDDLDLGFTFKLSPGELEFASTEDLRELVRQMVGYKLMEELTELGRKAKDRATENFKERVKDRLEGNRTGQGRIDQEGAGQEDQAAGEASPVEEKEDGRLKSLWKERKARQDGSR